MKLEEAMKLSPNVCTHFIREPGGPLVHAHVITMANGELFTMARTFDGAEASTMCSCLASVELFMKLFRAYDPNQWQVLEIV